MSEPITLVTGVSGYLGSRLARALVERGAQVVGVKRPTSDVQGLSSLPASRFHLIDSDSQFSTQFDVKRVFHTATAYGRCEETDDQMVEANVLFGLKVLGQCGPGVHFVNIDSPLPANVNAYAQSKAQFRAWLETASHDGRARVLNVRLQNMYGPGEDLSGFPSLIIRACAEGRDHLELTAGNQVRDFIYIDDVIEGVIAATDAFENELWRQVDVGSGAGTSIREFAELVRDLLGSRTELRFGALPSRDSEPDRLVADLSWTGSTGWAPEVGLIEGLNAVLNVGGWV